MNKKLLTEFLGTFFLLTVVSFTGNPLAIGAVLAVLVYGGGHISGAHFNPAVTLALFLKKKILQDEALKYVLVQICAGIVASAFFFSTHQTFFIPQPAPHTAWLTALGVEIIFTFLLVRTILMTAVDARVKSNHYFGLAIGAALFVGASTGGPMSGGAFNPAVGVSPLLFDFAHLTEHIPLILLYILGPCIGAGLAAAITDTEK